MIQDSGNRGHSDPDYSVIQISAALDQLKADQGEPIARLIPLVYSELRKLASSFLRRERHDHTLQATALVHEAFLRLSSQNKRQWESRAQFIGFAARSMRQILVDHARNSNAAKRTRPPGEVGLEHGVTAYQERTDDLLALDAALQRLAELSERQSRVVELRFFGGLTVEAVAQLLGISEKTVKREWSLARAWLYSELRKQ